MAVAAGTAAAEPPNILFAMADDWSYPHASAYGAPEVDTPAFDRIAKNGLLFHNAFTAAPQCSPNRAAILTGRHIWTLEEAGTHNSYFPTKFAVFPDLLEAAGYHIGYTGKGWGPGAWKDAGWSRNPAGPEYNERALDDVPAGGIRGTDYAGNFEAFLDARPDDAPFFFWYGASEPHRSYEQGSGIRAGKDPSRVEVPGFLPDTPEIRSDMLDYFVEIEWFDTHLGRMIAALETAGALDNTIVIATGDNGMPFPGAKANLREHGTHAPLAIQWPARISPDQSTCALVSFIDFAPTFLTASGISTHPQMMGRSILHLFDDPNARHREFVLTGRERHSHARFDNLGYPARAIRTSDYLYIRNFAPDRWPAGQPGDYYDIDACPTKTFLMEHRDAYPELFARSFGKRPAEELFDVSKDPACLTNLVTEPTHAAAQYRLRVMLDTALRAQNDPRLLGYGDIFESYPRFGGMRPHLGGFAERGVYNPEYAPGANRQPINQ